MGELVFLGNLELVLVEFTGPVEIGRASCRERV